MGPALPSDGPASLPEQVRLACAEVAARARSVHIDQARLAAYADERWAADGGALTAPTLEPGDLPAGLDAAGTIAWVVTVNAVNFGSGFFPVLDKDPGLSGSRTVFARLRRWVEEQGPLTAEELAAATTEGCSELFGQDPGGPAAELMGWFAAAWRALGAAVLDRWDGSFAALVAEADGSAARLAGLLASIDGWADVATHDGRPVPLHKRAQIAPAHLALAFAGAGPGRFADLDRLTIFADNLVPHVLRLDGVLRFAPELVARIDAEELLVPGSAEEVEIRAVAVHAAELVVAHLRSTGRPATAMALDQVLWSRGARPRFKAHPRHRARTTAY